MADAWALRLTGQESSGRGRGSCPVHQGCCNLEEEEGILINVPHRALFPLEMDCFLQK